MPEASDIIAEITASIDAVDAPYDLTAAMVHYHPTTGDIAMIPEGDLPQIWVYYDSPVVLDQTTTVTKVSMECQLVYYYRHARAVIQDSLAAAQLEQNIQKSFRQVVKTLQDRQKTVPGVPDLWLMAFPQQEAGRMGVRRVGTEKNPVYMLSTLFTLAYDEEY